jgi:hypothetical protein
VVFSPSRSPLPRLRATATRTRSYEPRHFQKHPEKDEWVYKYINTTKWNPDVDIEEVEEGGRIFTRVRLHVCVCVCVCVWVCLRASTFCRLFAYLLARSLACALADATDQVTACSYAL